MVTHVYKEAPEKISSYVSKKWLSHSSNKYPGKWEKNKYFQSCKNERLNKKYMGNSKIYLKMHGKSMTDDLGALQGGP